VTASAVAAQLDAAGVLAACRPFLVGDHLSLADLAVAPSLSLLIPRQRRVRPCRPGRFPDLRTCPAGFPVDWRTALLSLARWVAFRSGPRLNRHPVACRSLLPNLITPWFRAPRWASPHPTAARALDLVIERLRGAAGAPSIWLPYPDNRARANACSTPRCEWSWSPALAWCSGSPCVWSRLRR